MRPRRTHLSDRVFHLEGGNEDNDLWLIAYGPTAGGPALGSTWVPTDTEREAIANGANIELLIVGTIEHHPPVQLRLSSYPLGKRPPRPA